MPPRRRRADKDGRHRRERNFGIQNPSHRREKFARVLTRPIISVDSSRRRDFVYAKLSRPASLTYGDCDAAAVADLG
jgi:hypothetical protein